MDKKGDSKRKYFDNLAEKWDKIVSHDREKLNKIISHLNVERGQEILDVGTGTGILIPLLSKKLQDKGHITAIDISPKMIQKAKEKYPQKEYPNVKFIISDILKFDFKKKYDLIILYSCLPHIKQKKQLIQHLSKGLKDSGKLVIAHSESREKINKRHRNMNTIISGDLLPKSEEIKALMIKMNLEVIKISDNESMFLVIAKK
jgi:demethylmenaquinone methyltransferase/2-methoxy-6-polyprenyl-1,4-benzoquinol methylase